VGFAWSHLALAAIAASSFAQTAPASGVASQTADEFVELSPFKVTTSKDVGYQADSTLSGMGLRTPLTDIASAISVITPQIFTDTASRDLRDVLVYQAGIEVSGVAGNFAGSTTEPPLSNNVGTRVRGLAAAQLSRNYYRSVIPSNAYNLARVDINRGANALLFGVGSPAGIINYSTQDAQLGKSLYEAEASVDNFGSMRQSVNANVVVIPKQFAVRIAGLNDRKEFKQKPSFNEDQRIYGAFTWEIQKLRRGLLSGTTIRGNFEEGRINANNPRILPPQDHLSGWFEDTIWPQWVAAGIVPKTAHDPVVPFTNSVVANNRGVAVTRDTNRSPVAVFPDPSSLTARDVVGTVNGQTVLGRPWVSNNFYFPTGAVGTAVNLASARFFEGLTNRAAGGGSVPDSEFYIQKTLSDPSIFDYYSRMLDGPNKEEKMKLVSRNIVLEQLFFQGKAGFEIGYDYQRATESRQSLLPEDNQWIAIDVNTRMWDGTLNPNFGRAMTGQRGSGSWVNNQVETIRSKAFFEYDATAHSQSRWAKWLGRHMISLLYQDEEFDTEDRAGSLYSTTQFWPNGLSQDRNAFTGKNLTTLNYLSESLATRRTPAGANIAGVTANRLDLPALLNGQGVFLTRAPGTAANANQPAQAIQYLPFTYFRADDALSTMSLTAVKNKRRLESEALALQSNLLDNHIVGTIGWRREEVTTMRVSAPVITNGENYRLTDDPRYSLSDPSASRQRYRATLRSWSVVGKLPGQWIPKGSFVSKVSLFAGSSENFDPPASASVNAFGTSLPPASGTSRDFGFNLSALGDRVGVRFTHFKTDQIGVANGGLTGAINSIVTTHLDAFRSVLAGYNPNGGNGFPTGYVTPPQALLDLYQVTINNNTISSTSSGVIDTSDYVAEGNEIEVTFAMNRSLRLTMNAAQQESTRLNSGAALRRLLYDTPVPGFSSLVQAWSTDTAKGTALAAGVPFDGVNSLAQRMRATLQSYNRVALADGAPTSELSEYRANLIVNYSFSEGSLKGFGIGGAARYQSKAAVGLPITTYESDGRPSDGVAESTDFRAVDTKNPFYGPSVTDIDAWVSYKRKIWKGIDFRVQLNVRNLFADEELIPVAVQPDGTAGVSRIPQPRTVTLTTQFSF
jgi:outer membrane receptor protein involved in Fe transport